MASWRRNDIIFHAYKCEIIAHLYGCELLEFERFYPFYGAPKED
jgi:hypothetical protein